MTAGTIISVGFAEPYESLIAIIVVGKTVTPAVFKTKNVIIAVDAVSLLVLIFCNSLIAFSPKGVAALPKPNILAAIFEDIYPNALLFLGTEGNKRFKIGSKKFANLDKTPASSAIFIIPVQSTMVGSKDIIKSNALFALDNTLLFIIFKFPVNKAYIIAIAIRNVHNIETIVNYMKPIKK